MKPPPIPINEADRLQALQQHQLLDSLPEEVYDDVTRIASEICGTPIALLTLVDKDRQWFKARQGLAARETPRQYSFCAHAIINPDEIFIVPDARYDDRFYDNPLTTGEPHVVFYAGVPVKSAEGLALGTLCVIDSRPRELTEQKLESLKALAKLVSVYFELRRTKMHLQEAEQKLLSVHALSNTIWQQIQALASSNQSSDENQLSQLRQTVAKLIAIAN